MQKAVSFNNIAIVYVKLLKLWSLNPISTHSLRSQTEPMNVILEEKQPQYKWKNTLEKDFAERLSQETKKVTDSINNTNNKSISDIDDFLGKIENAFISVADILVKKNFTEFTFGMRVKMMQLI